MTRSRSSSLYLGKDGYWHGRVTVGVSDDGSPDRRHVMGKSKAVVAEKVRKLETARDSGRVARPGQRWTLESWLTHWLEEISRPNVSERTYEGYATAVHKHLVPALGKHRLERLEPEHLERLYRKMIEGGAEPGTAHQVHRTVRTALGQALRRGHVSRNVAEIAKAPRVEPWDVNPYTVGEVQAILAAAKERRNSARWAVALALGLRQSEVLGLQWPDVEFDTATLWVREQLRRPKYDHGCGGSCGKTPGRCPQRLRRNKITKRTKSRAGRRAVGLPDEIAGMLKLHREEQDRERRAAGQLWQEGGWVFTSQTGEPLNHSTDYHAWKSLLKRANVREGRLHDARHTAATVLLVLGVPERTVMSIMGWSTTAMAARYQHVTAPIRRDVARRVGGLLWGQDEGK